MFNPFFKVLPSLDQITDLMIEYEGGCVTDVLPAA